MGWTPLRSQTRADLPAGTAGPLCVEKISRENSGSNRKQKGANSIGHVRTCLGFKDLRYWVNISANLVWKKADVMSGLSTEKEILNELGDHLPDCLRLCRGGRETSSLRVREMRQSSRR